MIENENLFKVDGLVAVITGAGSGLGRVMAHALASNGAQKVYVLGRRVDKLQQTADGYTNIVPVQADVTDKATLEAAVERIKSEVGFINVLVVNSGYSGPFANALPHDGSIAELREYFWSYSQDDFNQTFALNNTGSFFTMVAFLELLGAGNEKQNQLKTQSQVIFTASIAGYARGLKTGAAYIPSKAGVIQSAKMFSTLLAKWHIRVNALAPGLYPSEMTQELINRPGLLDTIPARRLGTEEDMRGAVLFLTSPAGAYMNGEIMIIDGGRLGQMQASY